MISWRWSGDGAVFRRPRAARPKAARIDADLGAPVVVPALDAVFHPAGVLGHELVEEEVILLALAHAGDLHAVLQQDEIDGDAGTVRRASRPGQLRSEFRIADLGALAQGLVDVFRIGAAGGYPDDRVGAQ